LGETLGERNCCLVALLMREGGIAAYIRNEERADFAPRGAATRLAFARSRRFHRRVVIHSIEGYAERPAGSIAASGGGQRRSRSTLRLAADQGAVDLIPLLVAANGAGASHEPTVPEQSDSGPAPSWGTM
jgi:hypothetical protein